MNKILYPLVLSLLTIICAFDASAKPASSSNKNKEYVIRLPQFDRIKVVDNVNVVYRCVPDSAGIAKFSGGSEFADAFILSVSGNTLKIQVNEDDVNNPELPTLYLYSDFLTSVENSSDRNIIVESIQPCPELKVKQIGNGSISIEGIKANSVSAAVLAGNGTITLGGTTAKASMRMVAAGTINADRLKAVEVDCRVLGTGNIGCWPVELLRVKGLGATKIYYKGDPEIQKTGSSKLFPLPE